jgi:hypothetical protein
MFGDFENLAAISALAFENAGGIVQSMREDVELGIFPRHERTVHPDETVTLVEGQN